MDRITHVRIENVRAIEALDLELSRPLTVLIGENGSGKSTILECLELLRKAADTGFMNQFYTLHRGVAGLIRKGASTLGLGVVVEDDAGVLPRLDYSFTMTEQGVILYESLMSGLELVLQRTANHFTVGSDEGTPQVGPPQAVSPQVLVLASFGRATPHSAIDRVLDVLRGIEVHPGFDTLASWASLTLLRQPSIRGPAMLVPAERLALLGENLATAWAALKNVDDNHWRETMQLVRLGLGEAVDSINTVADAGAGYISLMVKRIDLPGPIPAASLSDGQLSWLAFVALARLDTKRSLLAIDEPELHLHPSLLGRVMSLLSGLDGPVVLSTHSDRVLELLDDPADALRVCSLDGSKAKVSRIDAAELPRWLEEFGDLGKLRESGYLPRVLESTGGAK
ncbi:AAA family ATPase [Nannocystaceae bacterium ST9]